MRAQTKSLVPDGPASAFAVQLALYQAAMRRLSTPTAQLGGNPAPVGQALAFIGNLQPEVRRKVYDDTTVMVVFFDKKYDWEKKRRANNNDAE